MSDEHPHFTICTYCQSPRRWTGTCKACLQRSAEYRRQFCVRGCTIKGALMNNGQHAPNEPRRATVGLLCKRCGGNLREWIEEIPDLYATLDPRPEGGLSAQYDGKTHKAGKLSHSPALARLDVVALTDPRTKRDNDDPGHQPFYIPGIICQWAEMFREEQQLSSPTATITEAVSLMLAWWSTLVIQPWIDELWDTISKADKLLNTAHGIKRGPQPRGHCQECGHKLWAEEDATSLRCNGCKITYTGINILLTADSRSQAEKGMGIG